MSNVKNVYLTRFKVIVYHRWLDFIEVPKSTRGLDNDRPRLFLWNDFVLLQVKIKVVTLLVLQYCTKPEGKTNRKEIKILCRKIIS